MLIENLSSSLPKIGDKRCNESIISDVQLHKHIFAMAIDSTLLALVRMLLAAFSATILNAYRIDIMQSFARTFGHETLPDITNSEHFYMLMHSKFAAGVMCLAILLVAAGILYYGIMTSSTWNATIGQRIIGFYVTDKFGHDITSKRALLRVFFSYVPWLIFPLIPYLWHVKNHVSAIAILILVSFWHDMTIFCRERIALHDLITCTRLVSGRKNIAWRL